MAGQFVVGKDVLSFCNKCKLPLSHTIVSMKNENTIAKVQCNTCKGMHAFKDPAQATVGAKKRVPKTQRDKKKEIPLSEIWLKAVSDPKVQTRPYSIKGKFAVGDVIDHTQFGQGVVHSILDNTKIEVIFKSQVKQLVHNR